MGAVQPTRRTFLRAAGVSLALPWLESQARAAPAGGPPRRLVAVCAALGFHPEFFLPKEAGKNYPLSPYLNVLKDFRDQFTVISGLAHPDVGGGHGAEPSFLTGAPHPGTAAFRNSISLDQLAVDCLRPDTRFPSLVLGTHGSSISVNASGMAIPPQTSPSALFTQLFLDGRPGDVARQVDRLRERASVLDVVKGQAQRLNDRVSAADRDRLDQYFTAVREVEQRLVANQDWIKRPKPHVDAPPPRDVTNAADLVGRARRMLDLAHLALQTDSTRFITLKLEVVPFVPPIDGVTLDHHNLSHHGQDPDKLRQLHLIETAEMEALRDFVARLHGTKEGDGTLLDRTCVFWGSSLGNASSHDNHNLPAVVAGGGFKHGQHLAFDGANNEALAKLYLSLLERLGAEVRTFASAKSRLTGLELA